MCWNKHKIENFKTSSHIPPPSIPEIRVSCTIPDSQPAVFWKLLYTGVAQCKKIESNQARLHHVGAKTL